MIKGCPVSKKFDSLINKAKNIKQEFVVGVVNPTTEESLKASLSAATQNLITPILIGPKTKIQKTIQKLDQDPAVYDYIDTKDEITAAQQALNLVKENSINAIMKGDIHTRKLMQPIIAYEKGRMGSEHRITHCLALDIPAYEKIAIFTDIAINIAPDLSIKKIIIENAIDFASTLGIHKPKIAVLTATEEVNEKIQATLDAASLCEMVDRGQIKNCEIDGPLSFDLAISSEAAVAKHFTPRLTGKPDIFVVPDLNAGNIAIKIIGYWACGISGGVVIGAHVPIILVRRSSPAIEHMISCALAKLYALNKNGA